jgi:hypothetical protein
VIDETNILQVVIAVEGEKAYLKMQKKMKRFKRGLYSISYTHTAQIHKHLHTPPHPHTHLATHTHTHG